MLTILVWVFGMASATIMLASVVRQRREHLVDVLKKHVYKEVGTLYDPPATADSEQPNQPG